MNTHQIIQKDEQQIMLGKQIRSFRKQKKLSQRQLAKQAGISLGMLSQIENGKTNPSVRSLAQIANGLEIPLDQLFIEQTTNGNGTHANGKNGKNGAHANGTNGTHGTLAPATNGNSVEMTVSQLRASMPEESNLFGKTIDAAPEADGVVVRAEQRAALHLDAGVTWERLTPADEANKEFMIVTYDVGGVSGSKMSHHSGREFVLVLEGQLRLDLGFESCLLHKGDTIVFDAGTPHRLSNVGATKLQFISVTYHLP